MKSYKLMSFLQSELLLNKLLLTFELFLGLLVFYYCYDRICVCGEIEVLTEQYPEFAIVDLQDKTQLRHMEERAITVYAPPVYLSVVNNSEQTTAIMAEVNEEVFYQDLRLPVSKGNWFSDDGADASFRAVVPRSLGSKYKAGRYYEISFREIGEVKVYIAGVLMSDICFGNSGVSCFDDVNPRILLLDNDKISIQEALQTSGITYARFHREDREVLARDGIRICEDWEEYLREARQREKTEPAVFTAFLLIIFLVGNTGVQYLGFEEHKKQYAVLFFCGADTGRALFLQAFGDILWLLVPFLLSLVTGRFLPFTIHPRGMFYPLVYLLVSSVPVTCFTLFGLSRISPVEIIQRNFNE